MDEAEGRDLAGGDGRGACLARLVHPVRQATDAGQVRDHEVAARSEQRPVHAIPSARFALDVERAHQVATGRRAADAWSMARRRSSRPEGSNS